MVDKTIIKDMRMMVIPYPCFVNKTAMADDVAKAFITNPSLKSVYVVDDKIRLLGNITLKRLIKYEFIDLVPNTFEYFDALEFIGSKTAEDLMTSALYVKDTDTLKDTFVKMYNHDIEELPVIDNDHHLIGTIDIIELLTYLIEKKEKKANNTFLQLTINRPFLRT
jgi:CBS-domain-containing membrane protein